MSVIAWDGHMLAADKRSSLGTLIRTTTKIFRVGGALCAYAGDASGGEEILAWFKDGASPVNFPATQRDRNNWAPFLAIRKGVISMYEYGPHPVSFEDKCFAIGSGRDFALAAMHLGCNALKAVEVASSLDSGCGNGVDFLTLD